MILHELVHVFEPVHVDLEAIKGIFCEVFVAEALSNSPPKLIFEQGEIFETMYFGGIVHRFNANELGGVELKIVSALISQSIMLINIIDF